MSYIEVSGITAGYGKENIIENISFELNSSSLMGVIGANGCGKTTLLKAVCGILPHMGNCAVNGCGLEGLSAKQLSRLVNYIPQRSGITIDISALDVVLMGFNSVLGLLEYPSKEMKARALRALEQVGLKGREETNYLHLSEGQKQLCILARTLVSEGSLLLLDEPESALDFRFRHNMLSLIREYVCTEKKCAVVTLHDPLLALNFCDKLLLLSEGRTAGIIDPKNDPLDETEQKLSMIYGQVSLQKCCNRSGKSVIVMLGEEQL